MLSLYEKEFVAAAKAMPAEKYNFAPSKAIFAESQKTDFLSPDNKGVRTFAEQVKHVAQANYFFASTLSGLKPDADVKAIGDLKDKDQIVAALQAGGEAGRATLDQLTGDPLVEGLLLLHGLHPLDVDARIQRALDRVRPYLGSHAGGVRYLGGDIESPGRGLQSIEVLGERVPLPVDALVQRGAGDVLDTFHELDEERRGDLQRLDGDVAALVMAAATPVPVSAQPFPVPVLERPFPTWSGDRRRETLRRPWPQE